MPTDKERLVALETDKENMVKTLNNINEKVDKIYSYIFEWGMADQYAKKTSVDRLWVIVWSIIWFVGVWVWGALLSKVIVW